MADGGGGGGAGDWTHGTLSTRHDSRQRPGHVGAGGDCLSDRSRSDGAVGCPAIDRVDAHRPFGKPEAGQPMTKTRIIVIVGFLVAFGAGAVVGLQLRVASVAQPVVQPAAGQGPSWLRTELGLSPEQNEQMKNIWEALHASGRGYEERRHRLRDERDEAIAALLPPSAMGDYD